MDAQGCALDPTGPGASTGVAGVAEALEPRQNGPRTPDVDVLIPTLRRPRELERALRSVLVQHGARELIASIVVIDNSPEGSAEGVVAALRADARLDLRYVHEPRPGVATARNAGLAASRAPLVAFIDDDEEAPPEWLGRLRAAHLALGAAVTFGPVAGIAVGAEPALRPYLDAFFSRQHGGDTRLIDDHYGCGNAMMTRAEALAGPTPFDPAADRRGGEDNLLFDRLRTQGARFGWAADATVSEYAIPSRATLRYAFKRAFCYGQGPCQSCARGGRPLSVAFWMAVGAAQVGVYGVAAAAAALMGSRLKAVRMADRAVRGLGKVVWFVGVPLYGLPAQESRRGVRAEAATGTAAAPSAPG